MSSEPRLPRLLLWSLPLASVVACATPGPIVRLQPRNDDDVVWVGGRAVVSSEEDGVRVAAAFDHQAEGAVGFRLEVENQTGEPVDVTPRRMVFVTCRDESHCSQRRRVIDPEKMLEGLDAQRSREEAQASNDATLGATLMFLSVTSDVAGLASHDRHASCATCDAAAASDASASRHADAVNGIESERELWSTAALRHTTLMPGRGLAGHVYIPVDPDARLVWLQVEIDGRRFPFWFRQTTKRVT
jgi:hypothetical protein